MNDLYEDMIYRYMGDIQPVLVNLIVAHVSAIVERRCYQALRDIQKIIQDHNRSDEECFMAIENIVDTFEMYGGSCGSRHDF